EGGLPTQTGTTTARWVYPKADAGLSDSAFSVRPRTHLRSDRRALQVACHLSLPYSLTGGSATRLAGRRIDCLAAAGIPSVLVGEDDALRLADRIRNESLLVEA